MLRANHIFNVVFIWRSQAVLSLKGVLLDNGSLVADATGALRFPESYELGVAYGPIRNAKREFKVEVDGTLVRWSSIQDYNVSLSNGVFIVSPQNWSDAVTIDSGMEYKLLHPPSHPDLKYAFRLGYNHSLSSPLCTQTTGAPIYPMPQYASAVIPPRAHQTKSTLSFPSMRLSPPSNLTTQAAPTPLASVVADQ